MGSLIDDFLHLSRIGRFELRRQRVDLSELVRDVGEDLARQAAGRSVRLLVQPDVVVRGDPRLLRIVLENLLGNAWKFSSKVPEPLVEFGATDPSGEGIHWVRDNGAGFDMTYGDRLFGPFQRLHPASDFPGNGIGLAIVQRIIHRHGGRVWAEGELGRGATFYFTVGSASE